MMALPSMLSKPSNFGRWHLKMRLLPLIRRLIHSAWRTKILYVYCDDLIEPHKHKCLISANLEIIHDSEFFQVVVEEPESLPFHDSSIDAIIIDLSLIPNKFHSDILRECYRVLKDTGKALICSRNKLSLGQLFLEHQSYSRNYFGAKNLLKRHNFQILTEHPLSFKASEANNELNKKLIRHEKKLRKVIPILANYHCWQVIKSKDYYQPLPDYLRLSKTLKLGEFGS